MAKRAKRASLTPECNKIVKNLILLKEENGGQPENYRE